MSKVDHLHLFQGYGIEMEYMIVDEKTLRPLPITDFVLEAKAGEIVNEVSVGDMAWSNELVMHVIEVKTDGPSKDLTSLNRRFSGCVTEINKILKSKGAMLLGTAMHPLMDPLKETKLWPHDDRAIYDAYNRIFKCQGHGWSNLQSVHINLPFYNDEEFGVLHAAVRLILPILPALAASSPICEGNPSGILDTRLEFYRFNQKAVPAITGAVIPEAAFTKQEYDEKIFQKLYRDISPYDPEKILQEEWLNSRGAIARWDRNAIEIRVLDIQESPRMDTAIIAATVEAVRALADGKFINLARQKSWNEHDLAPIFIDCLKEGGDALIKNALYLQVFGVKEQSMRAKDLWQHIVTTLASELSPWLTDIQVILERGTLAKRILTSLKEGRDIESTYRRLAKVLSENGVF